MIDNTVLINLLNNRTKTMNTNKYLEQRISKLESIVNRIIESTDYSDKEEIFTYLCNSCNLTDVSFRGKIATCTFDMSKFYRRIQRRMHMQYHRQLKALSGKECKIICNMETQEWQIKVGSELEPITVNVTPQPGDYIPLNKSSRSIILASIGYALERIIDRMNESIIRKSRWKFNENNRCI